MFFLETAIEVAAKSTNRAEKTRGDKAGTQFIALALLLCSLRSFVAKSTTEFKVADRVIGDTNFTELHGLNP